jgi:prevent-host-death family protein
MAGSGVGAHIMTLDFKSLPMSELRTHPGEILDRVAIGGESFVIERNGRQKASLVPLSVFLPDITPARIAHELEALETAGEFSRTTITAEKEVAFKFRHGGECDTYNITVLLPHNYPSACPRVYVDPVDPAAPHRFPDGALCIFGVMSSWNPGKHTARDALHNARRWLRHYEMWQKSGNWPKLEAMNAQ